MSERPGDSTLRLKGHENLPPDLGTRPVLRFSSGSQAGKTVALNDGTVYLGRGSENDVVLNDPGVSREHCKLVVSGARVVLVDLNSTNGSFVGGEQVQQARLENGAHIILGSGVKLRFLLLAEEEQVAEQHLFQGATLDGLTGVANRRHWLARAREIWNLGKTMNVAICDLDHFKSINDRYGHSAGDAVLVEFCRRARGLGKDVWFGRFGGEEFVLLLPGLAPARAEARLERLRSEVAGTSFALPGHEPISVTVSVGLAYALPSVRARETLESLLEKADQALYAAKGAGRNRVAVSALSEGQMLDSDQLLRQKRRHSRTPCRAQLWLTGPQMPAQLLDLGIGGVSLLTPEPLNLDSEFDVVMREFDAVCVRMQVRWTRENLAGCAFLDNVEHLRKTWVAHLLKGLGRDALSAKERRRNLRVPCSIPFALHTAEMHFSGHLTDFGLGGLGVRGDCLPPRGLIGMLEFGPFKLPARAIWHKENRYGLRFAPLGGEQARQLQKYMLSLLQAAK